MSILALHHTVAPIEMTPQFEHSPMVEVSHSSMPSMLTKNGKWLLWIGPLQLGIHFGLKKIDFFDKSSIIIDTLPVFFEPKGSYNMLIASALEAIRSEKEDFTPEIPGNVGSAMYVI